MNDRELNEVLESVSVGNCGCGASAREIDFVVATAKQHLEIIKNGGEVVPKAELTALRSAVQDLAQHLVNSLDDAEGTRLSGDSGFWDWAPDSFYTEGRAALARHKDLIDDLGI